MHSYIMVKNYMKSRQVLKTTLAEQTDAVLTHKGESGLQCLGASSVTGAKERLCVLLCAIRVNCWAARNVRVWPFKRQAAPLSAYMCVLANGSVSCMSSCPVAEHCVRPRE